MKSRLGYAILSVLLAAVLPAFGPCQAQVQVDHAIVEGGYASGTAVMDQDPLFADPATGNYEPTGGSPALDGGDKSLLPNDALDLDGDGNTSENLPIDFTGGPRLNDNDADNQSDPQVELGAYEAPESTVLPVELAVFDARAGGGAVLLTWQTTSETANSGFTVQRRVSGGDAWAKVGYREGAGTTTELQSYRFRDTGLPKTADRLTYRLRQIDLDGTVHYSDPVTADLPVPSKLSVGAPAPNPAQSATQSVLKLPEERKVTATLYDLLGREVRTVTTGTMEAGRHELSVDVEGLPSGTYLLRVEAGPTTESRKVTVVR